MRPHVIDIADTLGHVAINDGDVVLAQVVRSGCLESVHRGHAVVVNADGSIQMSFGDPDVQLLPRSSNKPLQAAAMLRAGLELDGELLALAAASHSGEGFHVAGVRQILSVAGLDESHLQTPPDLPYDAVERTEYLAHGGRPERVVMNCSGKHAAMLVTCCINDWSLSDYTSAAHPLQQAIVAEIEDAAGEKVWATAIDGCGAPMFGLSLLGLARMGAACVQAEPQSPRRRVADAMRAHPTWVAGTRRDSAALMAEVPGLLAKEGADGVYLVALADGRSIALKITDGSDRARAPVMARILRMMGVTAPVISAQESTPILGGGREVGYIRGAFQG
jgi:L-asparaginase II